MTATIRVERRDGKTAYVVYVLGQEEAAFDWLSAAQIHCAVEDYEWEVSNEQAT